MDWVVCVSGGEDAVVGIREDGGQGSEARALWPVEHLRLKLGELVLQLGEGVGQSLDNAGVDVVEDALLRGAKVLSS